jgi:hypothetical protein
LLRHLNKYLDKRKYAVYISILHKNKNAKNKRKFFLSFLSLKKEQRILIIAFFFSFSFYLKTVIELNWLYVERRRRRD